MHERYQYPEITAVLGHISVEVFCPSIIHGSEKIVLCKNKPPNKPMVDPADLSIQAKSENALKALISNLLDDEPNVLT